MAGNDSTWHVVTVKAAILLGLLVASAACETKIAGGSADGAQIFGSVCASCHGASGTPDEALVARLGVKDLNAPELRARITAASVETQVRKGSENRLMPAFEGALTDAQIRAVAAYVASPAFPVGAGSAAAR